MSTANLYTAFRAFAGAEPPTVPVTVYEVGTTTKVTTYTDSTEDTEASNPVTADGDGNLSFWVDSEVTSVDLVYSPGALMAVHRVTVAI